MHSRRDSGRAKLIVFRLTRAHPLGVINCCQPVPTGPPEGTDEPECSPILRVTARTDSGSVCAYVLINVRAVAQQVGGSSDLPDVEGVTDHVRRGRVPQAVRGQSRYRRARHEAARGSDRSCRGDHRSPGAASRRRGRCRPSPVRRPSAPRPAVDDARQERLPSTGRSGSSVVSGRSCRRSTRCGRSPRRARCRSGPCRLRRRRRPTKGEQLAAPKPVQHAEADRRRPAVAGDRGEELLQLRPLSRRRPRAARSGLVTCRGMPTRAAGLRVRSPDSTASARAARSTIRKTWMLRRDIRCPPAASPSSQRATSSRSRRSTRIAPRPRRMWAAAHSYCTRVFAETSTRLATHASTRCPTVPGRRRPPRRRRTPSPRPAPNGAMRRCRAVAGGAVPVSVSMPSTRTTHLSRCSPHRRVTRWLPRHRGPP